MGVWERAALRGAVLHLERFRATIEAEVDRRLGRAEPTPYVRAEIVRRFRSFCRLASLDMRSARPSLDGLGGSDAVALERALSCAVAVAIECNPSPDVATALREMEQLFCAGIRRIMHPREPRQPSRRSRRRVPNAGKRVRAAIDRIGDAYIALNLDTGKIYDVNPAAETLLGRSADQLLDTQLAPLVASHHRSAFDELELRLDAGEDAGPVEIVFQRANGDHLALECMIAQHTIAAKRLAIFTARERLKGAAGGESLLHAEQL